MQRNRAEKLAKQMGISTEEVLARFQNSGLARAAAKSGLPIEKPGALVEYDPSAMPVRTIEFQGKRLTLDDAAKASDHPTIRFLRTHPGKERTSGHFGFAGHSDPVAFRNVRLKRL